MAYTYTCMHTCHYNTYYIIHMFAHKRLLRLRPRRLLFPRSQHFDPGRNAEAELLIYLLQLGVQVQLSYTPDLRGIGTLLDILRPLPDILRPLPVDIYIYINIICRQSRISPRQLIYIWVFRSWLYK